MCISDGRRATALATMLCAVAFGCAPAKDGYYRPDQSIKVNIQSSTGALPAQLELRTVRYEYSGLLQSAAPTGLPVVVGSPGMGQITLDTSPLLDFGEKSNAEELLGASPLLVFGSFTGVPDYLVMATAGLDPEPIVLAAGSMVTLKLFGLFRRTCRDSDPNLLEAVDPRTVLAYDPEMASAEAAGRDVFAERCGQVGMPADLGELVTPLSVPPSDGSFWVTELAFAPTSDAIYVLAGALGEQAVDLYRWKPGEIAATRLARGDFFGPLVPATGGASLIFNDVHIKIPSTSGPGGFSADRVKQNLVDGDPTLLRLPGPAAWPPERVEPGDTVLSPDGTTLATGTYGADGLPRTELIDVTSGKVMTPNLGPGWPLAWAPDGGGLLVQTTTNFGTLSLDGGTMAFADPPVGYPAATLSYVDDRQFFWTVAGPGLIEQSAAGTSVQLFSGQVIPMVEANRIPAPTAPMAAVVATSQLFAWAMDCAGIGWTSCNGELRRLSLSTGRVDVVARAATAMRFAVSPDGTKLALSDGANLYLKSLPP